MGPRKGNALSLSPLSTWRGGNFLTCWRSGEEKFRQVPCVRRSQPRFRRRRQYSQKLLQIADANFLPAHEGFTIDGADGPAVIAGASNNVIERRGRCGRTSSNKLRMIAPQRLHLPLMIGRYIEHEG